MEAQISAWKAVEMKFGGGASGAVGAGGAVGGGCGHSVIIVERESLGCPVSLAVSYASAGSDAQEAVAKVLLRVITSTANANFLLQKPQLGNELAIRIECTGFSLENSLRIYSFTQLKNVLMGALFSDSQLKMPLHFEIFERQKIAALPPGSTVTMDDF